MQPVFRLIENYKRAFGSVSMFDGKILDISFVKRDDMMVVSEDGSFFTIDIVKNGKLNDLFYSSTKIKEAKGLPRENWAIKYCHKVEVTRITNMKSYVYNFCIDGNVNVVRDNAFFLIFLSPIFDGPIKKRILQLLSYLCIEHSVNFGVHGYLVKDLVRLLKYKQSENE